MANDLPLESARVIDSAYKELEKRVPAPRDDEETFLNGFLFGMRWGLAAGGVHHSNARATMDLFMGTTRGPDAKP